MIDEKLHNETVLTDLEADFDGFLRKRDFRNCEAVIDNLRDMRQYTLGLLLARRLAAACMTVPDGYGEEDGMGEAKEREIQEDRHEHDMHDRNLSVW